MLLDAGPLRNDGSDKFFGMENVSFDSRSIKTIKIDRRMNDFSLETHGSFTAPLLLEAYADPFSPATAIQFSNAFTTPPHFENKSSTIPEGRP